jgi:hypothetical protein
MERTGTSRSCPRRLRSNRGGKARVPGRDRGHQRASLAIRLLTGSCWTRASSVGHLVQAVARCSVPGAVGPAYETGKRAGIDVAGALDTGCGVLQRPQRPQAASLPRAISVEQHRCGAVTATPSVTVISTLAVWCCRGSNGAGTASSDGEFADSRCQARLGRVRRCFGYLLRISGLPSAECSAAADLFTCGRTALARTPSFRSVAEVCSHLLHAYASDRS